MSRISRQQKHGERHHITNRASLNRAAFRDDEDRWFFLRILRDFDVRFEVEVEAFCFMTTHYHLVLACSLEEMAKAMHRLGFLYTQYFNDRHDVDGPLFSGRFYSNPIHDERYHRNAVRYIHRNPLAIDKNMDLARYRWSSHAVYLGLRPLDFVVSEPTLKLFGGSREVFRDFVEDPSNNLQEPDIVGVQDAVRVVTESMPTGTPSDRKLLQRFRLRLVCLIALDHLGQTSKDVASQLQLSPSGVRSQASRARSLLQDDELFQRLWVEVIEKIGPINNLPSWWSSSWDS